MSAAELPDAILVGMDFSPSALRALDYAARVRSADGEITAVHVIDRDLVARIERAGVAAVADSIARLRARADEEFAWLAKERPGLCVPLVVEGVPFAELVKVAQDLDVDLLVLGRQGRSADLSNLLFGSTAEKVIRGAHCPVLCVP